VNCPDEELAMVHKGSERVFGAFKSACARGHVSSAPAFTKTIREYTRQLAEVVRSDVCGVRSGKVPGHLAHLLDISPEQVAVVATRSALDHVIAGSQVCTLRTLSGAVGRSVFREVVMQGVASALPDLAVLLERSYDRVKTLDEKRRLAAYTRTAKEHGVDIPQLSVGDKEKLGTYLVGALSALGLLEISEPVRLGRGMQSSRYAALTEETQRAITSCNKYLAAYGPVYGGLTSPPLPWVAHNQGGYRTAAMRLANPTAVRHRLGDGEVFKAGLSQALLGTLNAQQDTGWLVNPRILEVCRNPKIITAEIVREYVAERLIKPPELVAAAAEGLTYRALPEDLKALAREWKRDATKWAESRALALRSINKFQAAMLAAGSAVGPVYFCYFFDSRGRSYPLAGGLSPQGTDLQRGLLMFSECCGLNTQEARDWFMITGANHFGFDKAPLAQRVEWVKDNHELIMECAQDYAGCRGWQGADSPLQFLAWCFEYAAWVADPAGFKSHLPCAQDGTCNGLQHLSAMFRDSVGGALTNLRCSGTRGDAYTAIAKGVATRLQSVDGVYATWWNLHGVPRTAVKKTVMTLSYGVTKTAATKYVVDDYINEMGDKAPSHMEQHNYARVLVDEAWKEFDVQLPAAQQALAWLSKVGAYLAKTTPGDQPVRWRTPSGFPALQKYPRVRVTRVITKLYSRTTLSMQVEVDKVNTSKHTQAFAPNFVHSMDAAHMHAVVQNLYTHGVTSFSMTHDSFAVLPDRAGDLYRAIRKEFVNLYTNFDPVKALLHDYPGLPSPPSVGNLDLHGVLNNEFFFS
jgi:DNA-directed RNA polymerase